MSNLMEMFFKVKTDEEAFKNLAERTKDMPKEYQERVEFTLACYGVLKLGTAALIRSDLRKRGVEESMESAAL